MQQQPSPEQRPTKRLRVRTFWEVIFGVVLFVSHVVAHMRCSFLAP